MTDEVLYHPAAALAKTIENLVEPDRTDLVHLMIEHLDEGVPRAHLARAVEAGRFGSRVCEQAMHDLLDWAVNKTFSYPSETADHHANGPGDPDETTALDSAVLGSEGKAHPKINLQIVELARAAAESERRLEQHFRHIACSERHPGFPPGWGLDTLTWSQVFGPHDPVPTIEFYLRNLFDDAGETRDYVDVRLDDHDIAIWRAIVEALSLMDWQIGFGAPELSAEQKVRALIAVLGLPDKVGPALGLGDRDTGEIMMMSPGWMASRLIDWWALADIEWHRRNDEKTREEVPGQAEVVYRIMIRHLVDLETMSDEELDEAYGVIHEDLEDLPNYAPTGASSHKRIVEAFWEAFDEWEDDRWRRAGLTRALYHARGCVFAGRFPFPYDSIVALADLSREEGYWLAHFCNSQALPEQVFPYLSFHTTPLPNSPFEKRQEMINRARRRLLYYRSALEEMVVDGMIELARAWWAFFMASQSQMFAGFGFGVSAAEARSIVEVADDLQPDPGIAKAFAFVRLMALEEGDPLMVRTTLALIPGHSGDVSASVIGEKPANDFLTSRITPEVWKALHSETRQDLIDAENLWDRAARELGAGRLDWGGLGIVYARAVERETKAHVLPLLEKLRSEGRLAKGRRIETIGSIVSAVGTAIEELKPLGDSECSALSETLTTIHEAFSGNLGAVTKIRNRAAHGDSSAPVLWMEFVELRSAIFEGGAFRTILACRQAAG